MADLTPVERRIAAHLLRQASEEFSNHGCNDLELRSELGLTEDEAFEFLTTIRARDSELPEPVRGPQMYTMDWLAMAVLADKLAPRPPGPRSV